MGAPVRREFLLRKPCEVWDQRQKKGRRSVHPTRSQRLSFVAGYTESRDRDLSESGAGPRRRPQL